MRAIKILTLALLVLGAPAAWAGQAVDETVPAEPDARVAINNLAGSVVVTGWNRNEVRVTGTLGDDVERLEVSGGPGSVDIEVKIPEGRHSGRRDLASELEVWVPSGARLSVETVSASIRAEDLNGRLDLQSVSGDVTASGQPEEVELQTVSGEIHLSGLDTRVRANSVSGTIELDGVAGEVEAQVVSGDVMVSGDRLERGEFQAVSGDVHFIGDLAPGAHFEAQSHSGDVVLELPASVSARFEVTTFSGDVVNELGPEARRTSRHAPGKELEFSTGSGDARVSVNSFSGKVWLKRR